MSKREKVYFASDLHLGAPNATESLAREKRFVQWLDSIKGDADTLYLVGDVFDFWFEYKRAAPRGFVRVLGKLAELSDAGVKLHIFIGNHDLWYTDYLSTELNATLHTAPIFATHFGKTYYIAHGDGLGPGDHGYKFLRKIFVHPVCKWLYARLHPNTGIALAAYFSGLSGNYTKKDIEARFFGEQEWLVIHSREILNQYPDTQYFVYGHRHIFKTYDLNPTTQCFYLGDWMTYDSYLMATPTDTQLLRYGLGAE